MNENKRKQIIAENITYYRKQRGITQKELAKEIGITASTLSDYINLRSAPSFGVIQKLADFFGIKKSDIDSTFKESQHTTSSSQNKFNSLSSTLQKITDVTSQLEEKRQLHVLEVAEAELKKQLAEKQKAQKSKNKPKIIAETPTIEYKVFFRSYTKAGPTGFGYDDYTDENTDFVYVPEEPPRHDVATLVNGDSMNPDYQDGDILYLRDYGASYYSGEECVVVIDDKSYFKKIYTTEDGLRLVSTNPDKETYPDLYIDFPPTDGTHIKIFNVIGSDTPIER